MARNMELQKSTCWKQHAQGTTRTNRKLPYNYSAKVPSAQTYFSFLISTLHTQVQSCKTGKAQKREGRERFWEGVQTVILVLQQEHVEAKPDCNGRGSGSRWSTWAGGCGIAHVLHYSTACRYPWKPTYVNYDGCMRYPIATSVFWTARVYNKHSHSLDVYYCRYSSS